MCTTDDFQNVTATSLSLDQSNVKKIYADLVSGYLLRVKLTADKNKSRLG